MELSAKLNSNKNSKGFTLIKAGRLEQVQWRSSFERVNGFTLIELLVVISILAVLSLIGFFAYRAIFQGARDAKRQTDLKTIQSALEQYYADNFSYPTLSEVTPGFALQNPAKTKTYLAMIPSDPTPSNPQYKYETLSCATGGIKCQNYCLYVKLENAGPLANMPSVCISGSGFDLGATKP